MSRPSKRMVPPLTGSTPDTQLMSVVLPEPFGPMSPKRSPARTDRVTPFSAVKPPKRLTSPSTSSSAPATASAAPPPPRESEDPLGGEDHEGDEHDAHDEQVHLRGDRHRRELLGRAEEDGADHGPHPARRAPDHGHGERVHGVVEGEGGVRLDERHIVREGRPRHSEEEAADGGGEELEAQRGHAHALRRLLVVAERGEPPADPRPLDEQRGEHS